jgi:hypothetical protein
LAGSLKLGVLAHKFGTLNCYCDQSFLDLIMSGNGRLTPREIEIAEHGWYDGLDETTKNFKQIS